MPESVWNSNAVPDAERLLNTSLPRLHGRQNIVDHDTTFIRLKVKPR